VKEAELLNI